MPCWVVYHLYIISPVWKNTTYIKLLKFSSEMVSLVSYNEDQTWGINGIHIKYFKHPFTKLSNIIRLKVHFNLT